MLGVRFEPNRKHSSLRGRTLPRCPSHGSKICTAAKRFPCWLRSSESSQIREESSWVSTASRAPGQCWIRLDTPEYYKRVRRLFPRKQRAVRETRRNASVPSPTAETCLLQWKTEALPGRVARPHRSFCHDGDVQTKRDRAHERTVWRDVPSRKRYANNNRLGEEVQILWRKWLLPLRGIPATFSWTLALGGHIS